MDSTLLSNNLVYRFTALAAVYYEIFRGCGVDRHFTRAFLSEHDYGIKGLPGLVFSFSQSYLSIFVIF